MGVETGLEQSWLCLVAISNGGCYILSLGTLRILIKSSSFLGIFCLIRGLGAAFGHATHVRQANPDRKPIELLRYYGSIGPLRVVTGLILGLFLGSQWIGLAGGVLLYVLPLIIKGRLHRRQQAKLEAQLIDGLGMMQGGLRAGFSLYQVMELVAREADPPLADIAGRIAREVQLGVPMDLAWQRAGAAVNNQAFTELVTAVTIQRQMGGDLGLVLGTLREAIREKINLITKLKSVTSQGRLTGIVIAILPLFLGGIIHLIMPKFIEPLFVDPIGQVLLGIALALEVVGVWMISRICRVET